METADAQPPRKRARQAEDDGDVGSSDEKSESGTTTTRSSDYWYDDGSIILQAESTQFRVHRSFLSQHSTVFRDMFEIPQPSNGEPEVEGCLIVHISDSAADVKHMLSSLYDKHNVELTLYLRPKGREKRLYLDQVSAMLRLGKKYDIEYQYRDALEILQFEFPSLLCKWRHKGWPAMSIGCYSGPDFPFDAINLALETNTLSILPAAYLTLASKYPPGSIIANAFRKDLPPSAQLACLLGRDLLLKEVRHECFGWLPSSVDHEDDVLPPSIHCKNPETCVRTSYRCVAQLWENAATPYLRFPNLEQSLGESHSFCDNCKYAARDTYERGCERMWQQLPKYFGLTSWADVLG